MTQLLEKEWTKAKGGGDGWESNPPRTPQQRPANGFEDRGRHQPPVVPEVMVTNGIDFDRRAADSRGIKWIVMGGN